MRIAIGSLMQETNTFAPVRTTLETFRANFLLFDEELFTGYGRAQVEIAGFIDVLREAGATIIPTIAANAVAGGPLTRDTFDALLGELVIRLERSLPLDGVLLALHGAMMTEDDTDAESRILAMTREVVGQQALIAASLDSHGLITPQMLAHADILVGYQTYPHTDMYATGARAARFLLRALQGYLRPTLALAKRPLIASPVRARTDTAPLRAIMETVGALEESGAILHASLYPSQPWLDVPELGFAALVFAGDDSATAQAIADELADMVWEARAEFEPELVSLDEAIRLGLSADTGVTVIADAGDAPTGGAAADQTAVLRALLAQGADQAGKLTYLTLCDAEAARIVAGAGIGNEVTVEVGHKISRDDGAPLTVSGRAQNLSDGNYRLQGAGPSGLPVRNGLSAVLAIGDIRLCLRSLPSMEWSPAMYTSLGLNPQDAALVFVKSPSHFRGSFAPLADRILIADTPGPTRANLRQLDFKRVTRPLYPLDEF